MIQRMIQRPRLRGTAALAAALLGATALGACGSDAKNNESPTAYAEAVASAWKQAKDTQVSEAQARCWGEKVVDRLGVDRVKVAGSPVEFGSKSVDLDFTALNLSQDEAQGVHDDFASCGGDLSRDKDLLVQDLGLPAEMQTCVSNALDDSVMKSFFINALLDGKDRAAANIGEDGLQPALEKCVDAMSAELTESLSDN